MRSITYAVVLAAASSLVACSDGNNTPTQPDPRPLAAEGTGGDLHSASVSVAIKDNCDPWSFDRNVGPGTCTRTGKGLTFDDFLWKIKTTHAAPGWVFDPATLDLKVGDKFSAHNFGGEDHTFTEVEEFGGGVVDRINKLGGFGSIIPECAAITPADIVEQGADSEEDEAEHVGTELYQCCIHPWMRLKITIHA
jgi:plastocyanin